MLLLGITLIASVTEMVSIGAIIPFLSILSNSEEFYNQNEMSWLFSNLGIESADEMLPALTIIFCVAAVISGASRLLLMWAQARLAHNIGADLSITVYRNVLYQPYIFHTQKNSADLIAVIANKTTRVVYESIMPLMTMISSILISLTIISLLYIVQPELVLSAFMVFGLFYGLVVLLVRRSISNYGAKVSSKQSQIIRLLQEGLGGIRDVILDGSQESYSAEYKCADEGLRRAHANIQIIGGSPRYAIESLGMVLIAWLAYKVSFEDSLSSAIPLLGALALGAQRLLPVMQQSFQSWTQLRGNQASLQDTLNLLALEETCNVKKVSNIPISFKNRIEFKDVSFSYFGGSPVLRDVNFSINKGDKIGVIGKTGSGKSTLVDLIMGLLQPTHGEIYVDDQVLSEANVRAWQNRVSHVPQAIYLSDNSVIGNVVFGSKEVEVDLEKVNNAVRKAELEGVVESLPEGLNSVIGERGSRLSGGQRQRLGIARALYRDADLIILDEATSALDSVTEELVMRSFFEHADDITCIIVAHREDTLKSCNRIIEVNSGSVIEVNRN